MQWKKRWCVNEGVASLMKIRLDWGSKIDHKNTQAKGCNKVGDKVVEIPFKSTRLVSINLWYKKTLCTV